MCLLDCLSVCNFVYQWLKMEFKIPIIYSLQKWTVGNARYFSEILVLQPEFEPLPTWSLKPKMSFQDKNLHLLPKNSTFILFCQSLVIREWEGHALSARQQHIQRQAFQQLLQVLHLCAAPESSGGAEQSRNMWISSVGTLIWCEGNGCSSPSSSFSCFMYP